jgi:hypothetical protein
MTSSQPLHGMYELHSDGKSVLALKLRPKMYESLSELQADYLFFAPMKRFSS